MSNAPPNGGLSQNGGLSPNLLLFMAGRFREQLAENERLKAELAQSQALARRQGGPVIQQQSQIALLLPPQQQENVVQPQQGWLSVDSAGQQRWVPVPANWQHGPYAQAAPHGQFVPQQQFQPAVPVVPANGAQGQHQYANQHVFPQVPQQAASGDQGPFVESGQRGNPQSQQVQQQQPVHSMTLEEYQLRFRQQEQMQRAQQEQMQRVQQGQIQRAQQQEQAQRVQQQIIRHQAIQHYNQAVQQQWFQQQHSSQNQQQQQQQQQAARPPALIPQQGVNGFPNPAVLQAPFPYQPMWVDGQLAWPFTPQFGQHIPQPQVQQQAPARQTNNAGGGAQGPARPPAPSSSAPVQLQNAHGSGSGPALVPQHSSSSASHPQDTRGAAPSNTPVRSNAPVITSPTHSRDSSLRQSASLSGQPRTGNAALHTSGPFTGRRPRISDGPIIIELDSDGNDVEPPRVTPCAPAATHPPNGPHTAVLPVNAMDGPSRQNVHVRPSAPTEAVPQERAQPGPSVVPVREVAGPSLVPLSNARHPSAVVQSSGSSSGGASFEAPVLDDLPHVGPHSSDPNYSQGYYVELAKFKTAWNAHKILPKLLMDEDQDLGRRVLNAANQPTFNMERTFSELIMPALERKKHKAVSIPHGQGAATTALSGQQTAEVGQSSAPAASTSAAHVVSSSRHTVLSSNGAVPSAAPRTPWNKGDRYNDTIARDILYTLGMTPSPGKKKRNRDEYEAQTSEVQDLGPPKQIAASVAQPEARASTVAGPSTSEAISSVSSDPPPVAASSSSNAFMPLIPPPAVSFLPPSKSSTMQGSATSPSTGITGVNGEATQSAPTTSESSLPRKITPFAVTHACTPESSTAKPTSRVGLTPTSVMPPESTDAGPSAPPKTPVHDKLSSTARQDEGSTRQHDSSDMQMDVDMGEHYEPPLIPPSKPPVVVAETAVNTVIHSNTERVERSRMFYRSKLICEVVIPPFRPGRRARVPSSITPSPVLLEASPSPQPSFAQQDHMRLSERLWEVKCRWTNCPAILNSFHCHRQHVLKVHVRNSEDYKCFFSTCGLKCGKDAEVFRKHVKSHLDEVPCPYKDCGREPGKINSMYTHIRRSHRVQDDDRLLLPWARGETWRPDSPLPALPGRIAAPSAVMWVPQVRPASLSGEYHRQLGVWVLRRIVGQLQTSRQLRAKSVPQEATPPPGDLEAFRSATERYDYLGEGTGGPLFDDLHARPAPVPAAPVHPSVPERDVGSRKLVDETPSFYQPPTNPGGWDDSQESE